MTIIEINLEGKKGSSKKIKVKCDFCGENFKRSWGNIRQSRKKWKLDEDYCYDCAQEKRIKSEKYLDALRKNVLKGNNHPNFGKKFPQVSNNMKNNNPMKQAETREKVSEWRKNMPSEIRKKYSDAQKECWASGKFDNVRVGQCKWFSYIKKNGQQIKLQGTWELLFAQWADNKNLEFTTHTGRISYKDKNGEIHNYYPDFYLKEWNCYIDIKNKYHMSMQEEKFDCIRKSNPDLNIRILLEKDLNELGVF